MTKTTIRLYSLALAAFMTLATLGGINEIAVHDSAAAVPAAMAAVAGAPRV